MPLKNRLFRIALSMLKSSEEAEDMLQEVMLKLWDKREKLTTCSSVEAFAVTITKNHCIDKLRCKKYKEQLDVEEMELDSGSLTPYESLELSENMKVMLNVFQTLPKQQRLLITLRDVEGYSYEEIAAQTGISGNNIRVGLSRARKAARKAYLKVSEYGSI